MIPKEWHKEHWIKTVTKVNFIEWGLINQPQYSAADLALIYDSHVPNPPGETIAEKAADLQEEITLGLGEENFNESHVYREPNESEVSGIE